MWIIYPVVALKNCRKELIKMDLYNVKTGDMTNILPFAALMGLACVAFIFLKKKKA